MSVKVISILNMKGGVGKTTLTINLAHVLAAEHEKKVLVIDLDPQANTSSGLLTYEQYDHHRNTNKVISDIFSDITDLVGPVKGKEKRQLSLDDMICNVESYNAGKIIDLVPSELELSYVLERTGGPNIEDRLKILLREKKNRYDFILVDCSPTFSVLTNNALKASDYVIIPVKPDPFSARGIPLLLDRIGSHNAANSKEDQVSPLGIVFNMVRDKIVHQSSVRGEILRQHPNVFRTEIKYTESYPIALFSNKSIMSVNAKSHFKENFRSFVKEFLERINRGESNG